MKPWMRGLFAAMLCMVFVGTLAAADDLTVRTYRSFPDRGFGIV
jgi:hypothetical protein